MQMKQQISGLVALAVALGAIALHFWQRPVKIAYAETSVLISEFNEAVAARKEFEEAQKGWDANLKLLNDSLMSAMESMKQTYDKAKPPARDSMRLTLQKRNDDLQRYTSAIKKMSQDKEKDLMEPVIRKMNGFLTIWGEEHGYDLILGTLTGGNILQANSKLNVTPRILKDLNEHYRQLPSADAKEKGRSAADTTPGKVDKLPGEKAGADDFQSGKAAK